MLERIVKLWYLKLKNIIIKNSKIHSKGIFANRDFKKGETILKHTFKTLNKKEFDRLPKEEKHFVGINNRKYLLFLPLSRYVNHSCDPNTKINNDSDIAIKDIKKGEEITTYYRDEDITFKMKCNCGNKNYKKFINQSSLLFL